MDIENESFEPYFSWDFGKHSLSIGSLNEKDLTLTNPAWKSNYDELSKTCVLRVSRACETSRFIIMSAYYNMSSITLLYDKKLNNSTFFNTTREGVRFYASFAKEDTCYAILAPEDIGLYFKDDLFPDVKTKDILHSLNDNSNCVLVRYILKK